MAEQATSERAAEAHRRLAAAYLGQVFDTGRDASAGLDLWQAEKERHVAIASAVKLLSDRLTVLTVEEGTETSFEDLLGSLDDVTFDRGDAAIAVPMPLRATYSA
jgi:hypothetical protein